MAEEVTEAEADNTNNYTLKLSGEGLYVFTNGFTDEDDMAEAECSVEDLEPWYNNGGGIIFPRKFTFKDTQYFSYFQSERGVAPEGTGDGSRSSICISNATREDGYEKESF